MTSFRQITALLFIILMAFLLIWPVPALADSISADAGPDVSTDDSAGRVWLWVLTGVIVLMGAGLAVAVLRIGKNGGI